MFKLIKNLLLKCIDDIDAGHSNLSEEECFEVINTLKRFTERNKRLSKYQACKYLNVSRATFDKYIREGVIPKGKKEAGFKELSWDESDLKDCLCKSK